MPYQEGPGSGPGFGNSGGGDFIGAAIQTGGMLYDSYQNRKASRENTDKTLAANKREAELAYQRSVEERNYMNMYNSPQAQMQRFIEAGLNPNLIYGRGSEGNQSGMPQYHPAPQNYNYQPMQVGGAIGSILPNLMAFGTWMQNMRLADAELKQKEAGTIRTQTDVEKMREIIEQLKKVNPGLVEKLRKQNEILGTQTESQKYLSESARVKMHELAQDFRMKFGDDLFKDMIPDASTKPVSGTAKMKYLQEAAQTKLKEAQASWTDFDITNPQQLIMLAFQALMGMAGASLRLRPGSARPAQSQKAKPRERPRGLNRRRMSSNHPDR